MRPLNREPEFSDFMSAEEYETSVPASFGLPEYPVLYLKMKVNPSSSIWCASDGVYIWDLQLQKGQQFDPNMCAVRENVLECPGISFPMAEGSVTSINVALAKCTRLFGQLESDSVEIAFPLEYETGEADDLGESGLADSIGQGMQTRDGPAMAEKRRRSS